MSVTKCYLCQHRSPVLSFRKLGYDILHCPACHLFFLDFNQDYPSFIQEYYNQEFFTGSDQRAGYANYEGDHIAETINMTRYLHRLKKHTPTGRLLDGGCATGLFMSHAANHGFDVYGFDISDYAVNLAQKRHPNRVKKSTVTQVRYRKSFFNVITLFDVVEHLKDPRHDLIHLTQFLKPNGLLVINTGDASSPLARLQGKHWHFFIPPQHLFFFSRFTLTKLLNQIGFQVIGIDYKGKWISLRYLLNLMKQIQKNPLASALYPLVTHNPIGKIPLYLNLFDNMIVYAKKA